MSLMEENLAANFIEPYTLEGQPLDFVLNDHFFSDVSFQQFNPVNNSYFIGFMLSILCTMVKQQVTMSNDVQYYIDDVLFGALTNEEGVKSIAVVTNMTSGKKIMLIQNFYFLNKTNNLKSRGLTKSERQNVDTMLENELEEKIAEFLIYRINIDPLEKFVCNQSNKALWMYVERITDIQESIETTENQVKKFVKLSNFLSANKHLFEILDAENNEIISLIIESAANFVYRLLNNPYESFGLDGFIHGILFASRAVHKRVVKVSVSGKQKPAIRLNLEPLITMTNGHNLWPAISFDFSPNQVESRLIGNFLARLIEVAAAAVETEKIMLEMTTNLISQLLISDKMHRKHYIKAFFFGMLYSQQAELGDITMSKCRSPDWSQIILQLSAKRRIIVFNFDRTAQLSIDGLKLKNFALGRPTTHVFVISIFDLETGCNKDLSIKDLKYDVGVMILKPWLENYPPTSHSHVDVGKRNFLSRILDLHERQPFAYVRAYRQFKQTFLETFDLKKEGLETFGYFLEGALHHLHYLGSNHEPTIKVHMFYSNAAYSVRLQTGDHVITIINFINLAFWQQFATYSSENQTMSNSTYNVFTFLYSYDPATDIFGTYFQPRNQPEDNLKDDAHLVSSASSCFHRENKTSAICPLDIIDASNRDIIADKNEILPESYRVYLKILSHIEDVIPESPRNHEPRAGRRTQDRDLMRKFEPIIHYLPIPKYSFLDYFSSALMVHSTFNFVDTIKTGKLSQKIFKSVLKGYKILNDKLLPGISILLGADALRNSIQDYADGDRSAYAIFNIFSAVTGVALSITLAVLGYFQVMAATLPVIGWVISAILYLISALWNADRIMEHVTSIVELSILENIEQRTRLVFLLGLSHELEKDLGDIPLNEQILTNALILMKKDRNIKHYIASASCFDEDRYRPCRDAYVDLRDEYIVDKERIARSSPGLSSTDAEGYKKLCDLTRIASKWDVDKKHELDWLPSYKTHPTKSLNFPFKTFYDKTNASSVPLGYKASYACNNAIGISRRKVPSNSGSHDVSLYNFMGDVTMYAKLDTINVILLSRGRYCSIVGGDKSNILQFVTIYDVCYFEGNDIGMNIVDFSALVQSSVIYTISTHYVKLEYNKWTTDRNGKQLYSSYIYLKNVNTFIVSEKKERDFVNIDCLTGNIDLKRKTTCASLYPITINDPTNSSCKTQVQIRSEGCVHIENKALRGKYIYTFNHMTGNVRFNLKNTKNITHRMELAFVEITNAKNLTLTRDNTNVDIKFSYGEWMFHIVMESSAESLQLSFSDGVQLRYEDNRFFTEIITENPIGRMWYDYENLLDTFNQSNIECRAYSEWNDETLVLKNKYMSIESTSHQFKASSKVDGQDTVFLQGYNVHFIIPDKCQLGKIPHKTIDWLFLDRDLDVTASIDALIIDLSLVMERLNIISKSSRLDVNLKIVENSLNLEVNAHIQHDEKNISLRAGGVHLRHIMYNNQYKAVRILTKSEFILEMDLSGKLEMKPVQKIVDPLNPVVILDMDTVEYGQTIFFTDRALINYDLVRVSESILVITNLASNMMKGLFLDAGTVPFLTVVLKQYTDEKMRSLKLKFEQDLQFDLDKLDQKRIISLTDFKSKIETMNQRMKQKPFIFRQDFRYDADEIRVKLWD